MEHNMMRRVSLAAVSYLVPTFALGFVWHLVLFKAYYDQLAMYRTDVIIPFGFLAMSIQALQFAWLYEHLFAHRSAGALARGLAYAAFGALLSCPCGSRAAWPLRLSAQRASRSQSVAPVAEPHFGGAVRCRFPLVRRLHGEGSLRSAHHEPELRYELDNLVSVRQAPGRESTQQRRPWNPAAPVVECAIRRT
jgi:hypothetical protein